MGYSTKKEFWGIVSLLNQAVLLEEICNQPFTPSNEKIRLLAQAKQLRGKARSIGVWK